MILNSVLDSREWVDLLGAQYLGRVSEAGGNVRVGDVRVVAKHIRLRPPITQQSHDELDREASPPNDRLPGQDGRVDGDSVRRVISVEMIVLQTISNPNGRDVQMG